MMAEEFENTSQDTQADVKAAGTMIAEPFEIARQATLEEVQQTGAEVQQTVNETKGAIGDLRDEPGVESLVGLIKKVDKTVENGGAFYHYSTTDNKKHIQNWEIYPDELKDSVSFYAKLTTLRAEKNGTIYVKINSTDRGLIYFGIYDKAPASIIQAPDQSNLGTSVQDFRPEDYAWFYDPYHINSYETTSKTSQWVIPVIAGVDYTFMYFGTSVKKAILNEFILGYTDTVES